MVGEVCSPDSGGCHGWGTLACYSYGLRGPSHIGTSSHCQYLAWVERGGRLVFEGLIEASSKEASLYIASVLVRTLLSRSEDSDATVRFNHTVYGECGDLLVGDLATAGYPPSSMSSGELSIVSISPRVLHD